jgi:C4-dicarboxylate-specific signal transduction histidine kinase
MAETTPSGTAKEELDARDLLGDVERLLRPQARVQRVALSLSLGEEPLPLVAQRDRLKQALVNVAINALEAMTEGGALALRPGFWTAASS